VISIRRLVFATACLFAATAVTAAPAGALYYRAGPQKNVDKGQLEGWQQCFSGPYGDVGPPISDILTNCHSGLLMLAGGQNGSSTLTVLAAAPRADVIFDTGRSNTPHDANGSGWYFNGDYSWGFAKQGDPIERDNCDIVGDSDDPTGPNGDLRLCWHTQAGALDPGFRAGTADFLNSEPSGYTRYVYQATCDASVQFGKVRRNRKKGTATLPVIVPVGGTLTASGKGLKPFQTNVAQTGTVDLPVKPKGGKQRALKSKGKAKVKETLTFAASCGATGQGVSKIKLRKRLG
jgi:hypothetical protein